MHPIIEEHRPELEAACRKFGVLRLEVFGSAARGEDFDAEKSDVDFVAEFRRPGPMNASDQYFGFLFALEDALHRNVDIVEIKLVKNPYLLERINQDRALLYDAQSANSPG